MRRIINNDRGSVMTIALLILVLLNLIVIFSSRTSTTDVEISSNDKFSTAAFYLADAGAYGSAKVVGKALELGRQPELADLPGLDYIVAGTNSFYDQIKYEIGNLDPNADLAFGSIGDEDLEFRINGREVNVDVVRTGQTPNEGGQNEFASGAEGMSNKGGYSLLYRARSIGEGPKDSRAEVCVQYRKVPEIPGGL